VGNYNVHTRNEMSRHVMSQNNRQKPVCFTSMNNNNYAEDEIRCQFPRMPLPISPFNPILPGGGGGGGGSF